MGSETNEMTVCECGHRRGRHAPIGDCLDCPCSVFEVPPRAGAGEAQDEPLPHFWAGGDRMICDRCGLHVAHWSGVPVCPSWVPGEGGRTMNAILDRSAPPVREAKPDDRPCGVCGFPKREHAIGYSRSRCDFRPAPVREAGAETECRDMNCEGWKHASGMSADVTRFAKVLEDVEALLDPKQSMGSSDARRMSALAVIRRFHKTPSAPGREGGEDEREMRDGAGPYYVVAYYRDGFVRDLTPTPPWENEADAREHAELILRTSATAKHAYIESVDVETRVTTVTCVATFASRPSSSAPERPAYDPQVCLHLSDLDGHAMPLDVVRHAAKCDYCQSVLAMTEPLDSTPSATRRETSA